MTSASGADIHHRKVLQKVVMTHFNSSLPDSLDPLQFVYCCNRSKVDVISLTLSSSVEHVHCKVTCI